MFDSSSKFRTVKNQKSFKFNTTGNTQEQQAKVNVLRSRYDEFIRYCDKQFEEIISELRKRNKLKNTVIILSSDHGESFEHNYFKHIGSHLYEQVTHIPLVIKEPGQNEGQIINSLAEQIDIPPTILDLADIPMPSWMEGRSLVPLLNGKKLPSKPIFSMQFMENSSRGRQIITRGTIAVWEGDYKLIHYLNEEKSLLFNLKQDPDELNNLFDKETEAGPRLLNLIKDNLKRANEKIIKEE
jgi:arylsulfatase A-like enzyme